MTNLWLEWWQEFTFWWRVWYTQRILVQLAGFGLVLIVALILHRILQRYRSRLLGERPLELHRRRAVLWSAIYPVIVLLLGSFVLAIYSAAGWPTETLQRLVSFFWCVLFYALLDATVRIMVLEDGFRRTLRRLVRICLGIIAVLYLSGLSSVLWTLASEPVIGIASRRISVATVGVAIGIAAGFWLAAQAGRTLFLRRYLPRTHVDPGLAHSVAGFVQFVIVILGLWIALRSLGVELSNLALLITALTVGIGFGLQDVVKNVMGGVILLSEGHVRPQEVFKIGGETGRVERIGLRSTTVRTWDGAQVIVPNSFLISEKVSDLTHARRVEVEVVVSCEADTRLVERLLLESAAAHPEVLDEPAPSVLFTNMAEGTFNFVLYCHAGGLPQVVNITSDLHHTLVEVFRMHGVELPRPQRDLYLRYGPWDRVSQSVQNP